MIQVVTLCPYCSISDFLMPFYLPVQLDGSKSDETCHRGRKAPFKSMCKSQSRHWLNMPIICLIVRLSVIWQQKLKWKEWTHSLLIIQCTNNIVLSVILSINLAFCSALTLAPNILVRTISAHVGCKQLVISNTHSYTYIQIQMWMVQWSGTNYLKYNAWLQIAYGNSNSSPIQPIAVCE